MHFSDDRFLHRVLVEAQKNGRLVSIWMKVETAQDVNSTVTVSVLAFLVSSGTPIYTVPGIISARTQIMRTCVLKF